MTPSEIRAEIERAHVQGEYEWTGLCLRCENTWPCPQVVLTEEISRLTARVEEREGAVADLEREAEFRASLLARRNADVDRLIAERDTETSKRQAVEKKFDEAVALAIRRGEIQVRLTGQLKAAREALGLDSNNWPPGWISTVDGYRMNAISEANYQKLIQALTATTEEPAKPKTAEDLILAHAKKVGERWATPEGETGKCCWGCDGGWNRSIDRPCGHCGCSGKEPGSHRPDHSGSEGE